MEVFKNNSVFVPSTQKGTYPYKYVTITSDATYFGRAPLTGIRIVLSVDYSMVKTLQGNFGLVTFLDHPVVITLSGILDMVKSCNIPNTKSISALFNDFKASASTFRTIDLTIGTTAYQAALINVTQQDSKDIGCMDYTLTLYGARKTVGKK